MLIACWALALLMLALTLVWILKGFVVAPTVKQAEIDIAAFRNVLSLEDNRVLREALSMTQYRQLKRARVRAIQEYVGAIAANCAVTIAVLRARGWDAKSPVHGEMSSLVRDALRIRVLCLGFWLVLWAEFVFPNMEIRPMQIAGGYERLRLALDQCLDSAQASLPAR
jgi:hypothetical protein